MTDAFAYRLLAGSVDFLVHLNLLDETAIGGRRHRFVSEVVEINGIGEFGRPATTTVFAPGPDGRAVPAHAPALPARAGPRRVRPGVPRRAAGPGRRG